MVIAIDGPAGSGKSTIAKLLAKKLGFLYLDTGAMYRALTLKVLKEKVSVNDQDRVSELAGNMDFFLDDGRVFLDGNDVSLDIRKPDIEDAVSQIAAMPKVRAVLVDLQRMIASQQDCVSEGRDTTTVVFPRAEVKIFLDASLEERTKRRLKDFNDRGIDLTAQDLKDRLVRRDEADYTRKVGALKKSVDAVYLDTTGLGINEVAERILSSIKERPY